jgi:hypothetical protein
MANARYYSANAQPSTLGISISPSATSISLASPPVGWPSLTPFIIALDYNTPAEEICLVTSLVGANATITRAYDGTSATSHNAGAGVRHTWSAIDGTDARTHEAASTGVHGILNTSSVVGTQDVQTLTNKTLVTPSISGTVSGNGNYVGIMASPSGAGLPGFVIEGAPSQTGDLQDWENSSAVVLSKVDAAGIYHGLSGLKAGATDQFSIGTDGIPHAAAGLQAGSSNQFTVDASGNTTTSGTLGATGAFTGASNLNTGIWSFYTPTWTGSVSNPAIGNGMLAGRYTVIGKLVHVNIVMDAGTTTTFGSGIWSFGLPFAAITRLGDQWTGSAMATQSPSNFFPGIALLASGASTFIVVSPVTSTGPTPARWSDSSPQSWNFSGTVTIDITYEVA